MKIYILNAETTDLYKIGITRKNIDKRISSLQTGCPNKISLIWEYKTPHASNIEKIIHRHFSYIKSNGEWFLFQDVSIEEVKTKILKIEESVKILKNNEKENSDRY